MHHAGYRALGLDWHYQPFEVEDLAAAVAAMRALAIRGLGISMPFKLEIMPLLDSIDARAEHIGAVNTVVNDDGILRGYNTDVLGGPRALAEAMTLQSAPVLLLGAGGAARALAAGLKEFGCSVTLCNRSNDKAELLAKELACQHTAWRNRSELKPYAAVVNATSMGMLPLSTACPLDIDALHSDLVVMDIVYKPLETPLIRAARTHCRQAISGERMLLHQAAAQFELYTEHKPPLQAMEQGLRECMVRMQSSAPATTEGQ